MRRRDLIALSAPAAALATGGREEAPAYTATTLTGERFTKASLKGRVVLVQLWTTWCGYCRREQPIVDQLVEAHVGRGLTLLAVNMAEPRRKVEQYLREHPRRPHVVLSQDTDLGDHFHAGGFPVYVVIDRDGKIADAQQGAGGAAPLRAMLAQVGLK